MKLDKIKIVFSDFWGQFDYNDNYFIRILRRNFDVIIDYNNPDYVIYSTYGINFLKYKSAIKIIYIAENVKPNFWESDFSISFNYESFENRNIRFPLYVMYGLSPEFNEKKDVDKIYNEKIDFCSMVVSNQKCKERIKFFTQLNKKKSIYSGGLVLNNIGGRILGDKLEFIKKFRFNLAFENSSNIGYTTEKILDAMKANCIPIYWGNKKVISEFNPRSFINMHDFSNNNHAIEYIMEIENDEKLYKSILAEPWFENNVPNIYFNEDRFCIFFEKIILKKTKNFSKIQLIGRNGFSRLSTIRKRIKSKVLNIPYCQLS